MASWVTRREPRGALRARSRRDVSVGVLNVPMSNERPFGFECSVVPWTSKRLCVVA
ncbi:MAG: hypothetical protein IPN77_28735 [Sandaracinaceae bacterium]|nr:hypothetical protein [Sandaracinaceae bacterium]